MQSFQLAGKKIRVPEAVQRVINISFFVFFNFWLMPCYSLQHSLPLSCTLSPGNDKIMRNSGQEFQKSS